MKRLLPFVLLLLVANPGAAAEPTRGFFLPIDAPAEAPNARITPYGVSGDGSTVVGGADLPNGGRAFRWTPEAGLEVLEGHREGGWTVATAASWDGSVVVGRSHWRDNYSSRSEAFRWTRASGLVGLGDFAPDEPKSAAYDVSDDGRRIVGSASDIHQDKDRNVGFIWTAANGMIPLAHLPEFEPSSYATAISANGTAIVGTGGRTYYPNAFLWRYGVGIQAFGIGRGNDVSRDGFVVVGSLGRGGEALLPDSDARRGRAALDGE